VKHPVTRLSVTQVDQSKTVDGSPSSFCRIKFHPEILMGSPRMGVKQGSGGENEPFSSFEQQYLENGRRYVQSYC